MIRLYVGYNFDEELITYARNINCAFPNIKISEFYGSTRNYDFFQTARPNKRLKNISLEKLTVHISNMKSNGINFNFVLNAVPTHLWYNISDDEVIRLVRKILNTGAKYITVSNMYLLYRIIELHNNSKLKVNYPFLVVSTIAEIDDVDTINYLLSEYNRTIARIIPSIYLNRSFQHLSNINNPNKIELLVNEFCTYMGLPCIYRRSCYEIHSIPDISLDDPFPLKECSKSRIAYPVSFLKAPVIFPWSLSDYKLMKFDNFKISGRTLPTKFITYLIKAYMSKGTIMNDNILLLWGHVDKIGTSNLLGIPSINISARKLQKMNFLNYFIKRKPNCRVLQCDKCGYCMFAYTQTIIRNKDLLNE